VDTGKELRSWSHVGGLEAVAFAPDGKSLVTADGSGNTITCWDLTTDKEVARWKGRQPLSLTVAFSADGTKVVAGGWDNTVRLWDAATGREEGAAGAPGHQGWVYGLCFLPDGKTLVSAGSDGLILVWDTARRREIRRLRGHEGRVWSLALAPDGKTLASGGSDETIRLWDVATGKETRKIQAKGTVRALAFAPDGARLASASGKEKHHPGTSWDFWDSDEAEACVWEEATGKRLRQLRGHPDGVQGVNFSPDGRLLATAGSDGTVRLWDAATGREQRRLGGRLTVAEVVAFSPDGRTLAAGGEGGPVRLWNVATGEKVGQLEGLPQWVVRLAFSPDGRTLATTTPNVNNKEATMCLWDVATGKGRAALSGHQDVGYAVAFSPDGRTLASGGADSAILLWDVADRLGHGRWTGTPLSGAQLTAAWCDPGTRDVVNAHQAVWSLVDTPRQVLPLLRDNLKPAKGADVGRLALLIAGLDSDELKTREESSAELELLADQVEAALHKALKETASAEVRARLKKLLELSGKGDAGERLRRSRALEVLEQTGGSEAREVLEAMANGAPEAALTQEAREALRRLRMDKSSP
jgi:WD40 repeat protein